MLTSCIDSQDRFGFAEPYLDGFAQQLEQKGYTEGTVRRRVRAAAHFGFWIQRRKLPISELTDSAIDLFGKHLPSCLRRRPGSDPFTAVVAAVEIHLFDQQATQCVTTRANATCLNYYEI